MSAQNLQPRTPATSEHVRSRTLNLMKVEGSGQDLNSREIVTVSKLDENSTMDTKMSWRAAESVRCHCLETTRSRQRRKRVMLQVRRSACRANIAILSHRRS